MRKRILVTTLIVVLLGMLVYSVVSAGILHRTLLDEAEVALAAVAAMYDGGGADDEAAAALSKDTGGMTVTFLDETGKVTGDSAGTETGEDLSSLEEVGEALAGGSGSAPREDADGVYRLWYCERTASGALIRIAMPVPTNGDVMLRTLPYLGWFMLLAVVFSLIFTYFATAWILRPVEELAEKSRTSAHISTKYPELDSIADILNRKNDELYEQVDIIKREQARVHSAQESKNEFISNITHEMNTPLTSIKGFADLLEAGSLDEEGTKKAVSVIKAQSDRLSGLIACIINYNELSDDELPSYECDVTAVARETA